MRATVRAQRRLLFAILVLMVALAGLATALALAVGRLTADWQAALANSLTVEIAPLETGRQDGAAIPDLAERINRALRILRSTPGVAAADALSQDRIATLIEPWLGRNLDVATLPLPGLITVTPAGDGRLNLDSLRANLERHVAGAVVNDHGLMLADLDRLARSVALGAWVVALLVGLAGALAVAATARARLETHHEETEVLRLLGATDGYIAGQVRRETLSLACVGALVGSLLATGLVALLAQGVRLNTDLLPGLRLGVGDLAVLVLVPLGAIVLTAGAAEGAVRRLLRRLP